jgi:hypothetical protein
MTDMNTNTLPKISDVNSLTAAEMEDMCMSIPLNDSGSGSGAIATYEGATDSELEEIYRAFDEMLERDDKNNPQEIGYCGFPCDGRCQTCGGCGGGDYGGYNGYSGGFDMSGEV